jgi:hypothetical protein
MTKKFILSNTVATAMIAETLDGFLGGPGGAVIAAVIALLIVLVIFGMFFSLFR